jgi:hypothetical protein
VAKRRQVVLTRKPAQGETRPLGTRREVGDTLGRYNTSPDGGPARGAGTETLYGPGMVVELPTASTSIVQAMVSMTDEELALPVLMRMCKEQGWQMVDLETGRAFG